MPEGRELPINPNDLTTRGELAKPQPTFAIESAFDLKKAKELGTPIERQISPYEKAYTFKDHSYIVWTEGPKAGKVYRIINSPSEERTAKLPKMEEIESQIVQGLSEADTIWAEFQKLNEAGDERKYDVAKKAAQRLAEIYIYMHQLYHGNDATIGLEQAQLYDLDGEGQKYFDFIATIDTPPEKLGIDMGYKTYLKKLAHSLGLEHVGNRMDGVGDAERKAFNHFYYDLEETHYNYHENPDDPLVLIHKTYNHALTNVLQLGGLASKNYFESHGIQKRLGGESGGKKSYTADSVSFWFSPEGKTFVEGGYGSKRGFEYPIAFGIDKSHTQGLKFRDGTMQREKVAQDFLPLANISHIFVPEFKIAEVQKIFEEHNFGHVKVLPLKV